MDHEYRLTARDHNVVVNTTSGDKLKNFPIEKARFRNMMYDRVWLGDSFRGGASPIGAQPTDINRLSIFRYP